MAMSLSEQRKLVYSAVLAMYRTNPEALQKCLPEVAQLLDSSLSARHKSRSPFGLTENERNHHLDEIRNVFLKGGSDEALGRERAIRVLEHCAALIEDGSLPLEMNHQRLMMVLREATGVPMSSVKRETLVPIQDGDERPILSVAVVRGVRLSMTWDMRLLSIAVQPSGFRQRTEALRFVGAGAGREGIHAGA